MADKKQNDGNKEKKRKESILDLSKYLEKNIRVKFAGGREVSGKLDAENIYWQTKLNSTVLLGVLKGFDPLLNLVLDSTTEYLRDTGKTRFCVKLCRRFQSFSLSFRRAVQVFGRHKKSRPGGVPWNQRGAHLPARRHGEHSESFHYSRNISPQPRKLKTSRLTYQSKV